MPQLLAKADLWFRRTADRIDHSGSFCRPGGDASDEPIGRASLYLGKSGVHLLGALAGQASGDFYLADHYIGSFVEECKLDDSSVELLFGRSGLLVAGAMLITALHWSKHFHTENLAGLLHERANGLWKKLYRQSVTASQDKLPQLGMAHGWSGILYAQLLLHKVLGLTPAADTHSALINIAERAEPHGRGIAWLGTL